MKIWLSIDWDYFVREKFEWDWGHRESFFFRDGMWPIREAEFISQGLDLRKEMDPGTHSEPPPLLFWEALKRLGYEFEGAQVMVADSHMFASQPFLTALEGAYPKDGRKIVHFDAHHDMGYSAGLIQQHARENKTDCADWLRFTLQKWTKLQALVVYPAWKGLQEWTHTYGSEEKQSRAPRFIKRVQPTVWPNPAVGQWAGSVEKVFICRSGSWSPPWLDGQFIDLVERLAADHTHTKIETPFIAHERCDPLVPREYSEEQVRTMGEMMKTMLRSYDQ